MSFTTPGALASPPADDIASAPNWDAEAQRVTYPKAFFAGERYATVSGCLTPPYPRYPTQPITERKLASFQRRTGQWLIDAAEACPRPDLIRMGVLDAGNLTMSDVTDLELRLFDEHDGNRR